MNAFRRIEGIILLNILFAFSGCKKYESKEVKILLDKIKEIKISEDKHPLGLISDIRISPDSIIYILDISAADIKSYDLYGNYLRTIGHRGNDPTGLRTPRSLEVSQSGIIVSDVGFYAIKIFTMKGEIERILFIENFRPVFGNTKKIEDKILCTSLWDDDRNFNSKPSLIVIDTAGKIQKKIGEFPDEYRKYDNIDATRWFDINSNGDYVISYIKSPALCIGNYYSGKWKMIEMADKTHYYISENRKSGQISEDKWKMLRKEEVYNGLIRFLNDSIFVRSVSSATEESIKSYSQIQENKKIEFFSVKGEFIGEVGVDGVLREVFNGNLITENSDSPGNRNIGIYKPIFVKHE